MPARSDSLANKLIALGELSALTSVEMPRQKLLALFASKLHTLFGADAFAVWTYDPAEKTITLAYGHDLSSEVNACCVRPVPADLFPEVKLALDSGSAWGTENLDDSPLFADPKTRALLDTMQAHALLAVPLRALTRVLGSLTFYYRSTHSFRTDEKALALGFANALALSLNNIEAYERLVVSEHIKSEVIDIVAHQFRTPIATLRGNVELLKDESIGGKPETRTQIIEELEKVGDKLRTFVESFLNVKAIDEGRLEPQVRDVSPNELVRTAVDELERYRAQHDIRLTVTDFPEETTIAVDPTLIREVLMNVIGNAIKYAKTKVTVSIRRERESVIMTIEDDGIGIPAAEQPMIFQKLFRASNVARHPEASSGLGLYIANQYMEANGGTIRFTSTENVGTTFVLAFPVHGAT